MEGEPVTTQPGPADAYDYGYNDAPKQISGESKLLLQSRRQ